MLLRLEVVLRLNLSFRRCLLRKLFFFEGLFMWSILLVKICHLRSLSSDLIWGSHVTLNKLVREKRILNSTLLKF